MRPTPADIAEAEAIYDAFAPRFGMTHARADYIARLARVAMQDRLAREHRATCAFHRDGVKRERAA